MIAMVCLALSLLLALEAEALELRRPYEAAHAVSYGYDNDGGAPGCTDYHCGSICYNGHSGSDFPLSFGTNILAGADGTVTATNNSCADYGSLGNTCGGRCGNYVQIRHPNGDFTIYCHMRRDSILVSTGQSVSCGQVIGQSASSGSSTGPHLHLGWRPGGGSSTDVYAGSCNNSPGAWRNQNAYGQAPGAECSCTPQPEVCDGRDNNCDGTVDSGDVCEIELLLQAPHAYAPPKTTDVTGEGVQHVCARFHSGFRCFKPDGAGWTQSMSSTLMAESNGWGHPQYYSTIRMGDIDGDGRADVCARHSGGFTCWLATDEGFEEFDTVNWSNAGGWDKPQYYTTIRLADVNGNGRDDVCARGASGWRCYLSTPEGFGERIDGPQWSDAAGFDRARYYGTIRTGDIDGDGREDVCMRTQDGFECYRSTGTGFELLAVESTMSDANGWGNRIFWPSIRLADIDGDGTRALCARNSAMLFCQRFDGEEFGPRMELGGLSNDSGWADPTNYATLRVGDVTGDGSDELCIRANARMLCYSVDGEEVTRFNGPEWSNANGWEARASHGPLFITNLDGGEKGALCGRSAEGLTCEGFDGEGFSAYPRFDEFTDSGGWTARKYYSTIRMGQGVCRAGRCDVDDDPEDDGDVGVGDDVGAGAGAEGDGSGNDGDEQAEDGVSRITTSSCTTTPTGPTGLLWLCLGGLLLVTRRRFRGGALSLTLVVALFGLSSCERPTLASSEQALANESNGAELEPTATAPGTLSAFDELDLLAISGDWEVRGEPVAVEEGTDGPLRYRPVLVFEDIRQHWPLEVEMISEARLVGEGPTLVALTLNGTLYALSLDGEAEVRRIDTEVISQVSPSTDGCCIAYIHDGARPQALHVYDLTKGEIGQVRLGYSLGWAPAVEARGERVVWTASPQGFAAMLRADVASDAEPRAIVNGEEGLRSEELSPFPTGVHVPVWTEQGIAFEDEQGLWLIDAEGRFLAQSDAEAGMFWDEKRQELVNRWGDPIDWRALED